MILSLWASFLILYTVEQVHEQSPLFTDACVMEVTDDPVEIAINEEDQEEPEEQVKDCGEEYKLFNGNCYFFGGAEINWANAQQECKLRDANLVTIDTQIENDWLQTNLAEETSYWIGASDQNEEGDFTWISNGAPLTFMNWFPEGEFPNGSPGNADDCAVINTNGFWFDLDCSIANDVLQFICEK